jgi:glycosyltransferase involved in cell wall biosynthesis
MAAQLGLERYGDKLSTNGARFVDTEQFDVQQPYETRERAVGFIGRLDVEKRVPELVAAAKQLPDDITFVFVGDGSYRELLEDELAEEIETGSVDVVGWVDREAVPEQLNRLRLQVVPSHPTEGLPTAILEGMACGTPAYATPVSGVPDVVREGETGFLMDDEDGKAIAEQIERILDGDDLAEMSRACRETITAEYSFEGAVRRWRTILDERSEQ